MCDFLSALVVSNGDVLTHPMLDSHSDLVTYFKLPDGERNDAVRHFVKVELRPVDWMDPSTWAWVVDEEAPPAWWPEVAEQAEATLRARATRMILREGEHRLIVDGCWIVGGTAVVHDMRAGRILRVQDSAQVHDVWDSAQVHNVRGSAQVHGVGDSAQVHNVRDSAQVRDVRGSAQVRGVWGSAQVHDVWGSAQVHGVWGSAQVHGVWDYAHVHGPISSTAILDDSARAHLVKES